MEQKFTKVHFSKEMLLLHLFFPFILWYEKKYAQFSECYYYNILHMFSIFIKIFLMLQFTDRFSSLKNMI